MKNFKKPITWLPLIIAVSVIAGIWIGVIFNSHNSSTAEQKINDVLSLIKNDYVDEVNIDSLIENTMPDLLSNLDPHSTYIPAADLTAVNEDLDGHSAESESHSQC